MMLNKEMENLRREITLMARTAQSIFETALRALETRNEGLAEEVIQMDRHLDKMEVSLDRICMRVLALKDPYAVDFRYVFSVLKTTRDLERVGDESKTIAKWMRRMRGNPDSDILELGARAREALITAVEALIDNDAERAEKVLTIEFLVDAIEDRILESSPNLAEAFIAKALERVGDMSTNIAENVIFSVRAEDIRHGSHDVI